MAGLVPFAALPAASGGSAARGCCSLIGPWPFCAAPDSRELVGCGSAPEDAEFDVCAVAMFGVARDAAASTSAIKADFGGCIRFIGARGTAMIAGHASEGPTGREVASRSVPEQPSVEWSVILSTRWIIAFRRRHYTRSRCGSYCFLFRSPSASLSPSCARPRISSAWSATMTCPGHRSFMPVQSRESVALASFLVFWQLR